MRRTANKRKWLVVLVTAGAVCLVSCEDVGPLPPPPEPPELTPRDPEAIAEEILTGLAPLNVYIRGLPAEIPINEPLRGQLMDHVRQAKARWEQSENGRLALRTVRRDLEDRLKPMQAEGRAHAVLMLCDLIEILDPGNSRPARYRTWAETHKNRPFVVIRGWYEPLDAPYEVIYAFCEVYLPETGQVKNVAVRQGEEFFGLIFREILGDKSGMLLEYEATGTTFEVYGP
ncbi:MAG: hypothetical protein JXR94_11055 [Candidatus Hydrogenedentes bacterium]|nr:hypothetical protein [Candidatus Hydrogenedentota bacterium]